MEDQATLQAVVLAPVTEGGAGAAVAVQLAFDVAENPANCQFNGTLTTQDGGAIAGSYYQPVTSPFSLTPADVSVQQQFTIPIVNDAIAEPDAVPEGSETFSLRISNASALLNDQRTLRSRCRRQRWQ